MIKRTQQLNNNSSEYGAQEIERAERLNDALESLKHGHSPRHFSADPEFQEALKLHVATTNAEIDDDFREDVEEIILNRFGKLPAASPQKLRTRRLWPQFAVLATIGVVGVLAMVFVTRLDINKDASKTTEQKSVAVSQKNANTNTNESQGSGDKIKGPESQKEKNKPKQEPLAQTSGVELAGIKSEMEEVDKLKEDLEKTISDMELILGELEEIEQANDFDSIMNDLSAI